MSKKILITGGHVTPALAIIDAIRESRTACDIVFVGRKFVNERETSYSFEYNEVVKRDIPFIHLEAGRVTRIASLQSAMNMLRIPSGFMKAWQIVAREKPDLVMSFGGYIALPVALAAVVAGIPVFTHEQTIQPGLANRIIARVAKKVFTSFELSKQYFAQSKVLYSGNPIRKQIFNSSKKNAPLLPDIPCLYVTGGSMGAHSVNTHIERILPELLKSFVVIHQTGNVKEFKDYDRLVSLKQALPAQLATRYFPYEHILDEDIGWVYDRADIVVCRSGANTFFELIALKKPAVFIPLPWSANNEQRRHAAIFEEQGVGEVFEQNRPSTELLDLIRKMHESREKYTSHFTSFSLNTNKNATDIIISEIFT